MDDTELLTVKIRKGQIKHMILQILAKTEFVRTSQLLQGSARMETLERFKEVHMAVLRDAGLVRKMPGDSWTITVDGLARVRELGLELPAMQPAGLRSVVGQGNYDGRELQRTCTRVGAYDAFDLPSRMMGR